MTFPDFQRQMKWWHNYFTKMSLKAYKQKIGALYYPGLPDVHQILFSRLPQNFNVILKCKTILTRCDIVNLSIWRVDLQSTPWL